MACVSKSSFRKVIFLLTTGEGNVFIHVCLFTGGGGGGGVCLFLPTREVAYLLLLMGDVLTGNVPTRGCVH